MARDIPARARKRVRERDNNQCQYCGRPGEQLHHIIFRSHASPRWVHDERNLVLLCRECHDRAHNHKIWRKHWEIWQMRRFGTEWQVTKLRSSNTG